MGNSLALLMAVLPIKIRSQTTFMSRQQNMTLAGENMMVFGLDVLPSYQHHGIAQQLMEEYIEVGKKLQKKHIILTCKERLIPFYEQFGYVCHGVSASTHGGVTWYDMVLPL